MPVTLRDVALRAGVSRSAVSRTFTEGASVSPATRARVLAVAAKLGYQPNLLARGLSTRQTKLIGLVSNNFRNPVFLQIFDLFTKGLQEKGLRPLLVNLSDETDPDRWVQVLRAYLVDGVVVASSELPEGFAAAFQDAGLPVVHAFGRASRQPDVNLVGIDNLAAGRLAAKTLLARGYRRIGFMGGPAGATTTQDRLEGFTAALGDSGLRPVVGFAEAYSHDAGLRQMRRMLASDRAEAYFCGDDVLSIGAMAAVNEAGLRVPQDIGLIGLNDMEIAAWPTIRLTTIHQPFDAIVRASIDLMMQALDDPDRQPEALLLPCHLVERGTLRPLD
jgi:DNA-binding LacI/PurR family transcriptional regulator